MADPRSLSESLSLAASRGVRFSMISDHSFPASGGDVGLVNTVQRRQSVLRNSQRFEDVIDSSCVIGYARPRQDFPRDVGRTLVPRVLVVLELQLFLTTFLVSH